MSETTPEFQEISREQLVAEMSGGAVPPPSPPNASATAAPGVEKWPQQGEDGQWRDKDMRRFDPDLHRMGPDGVPEVTPGGYFAKRTASDPASGVRSPDGPETPSGGQSGASGPEKLEFPGLSGDGDPQQQALLLVVVEEMAAVGVFGVEWTLLDIEKQRLVAAWVETFKVTGVVSMPWWVVLIMAHWSIIGDRLDKPGTKAKLTEFQQRCGGWLGRLRGAGPVAG